MKSNYAERNYTEMVSKKSYVIYFLKVKPGQTEKVQLDSSLWFIGLDKVSTRECTAITTLSGPGCLVAR